VLLIGPRPTDLVTQLAASLAAARRVCASRCGTRTTRNWLVATAAKRTQSGGTMAAVSTSLNLPGNSRRVCQRHQRQRAAGPAAAGHTGPDNGGDEGPPLVRRWCNREGVSGIVQATPACTAISCGGSLRTSLARISGASARMLPDIIFRVAACRRGWWWRRLARWWTTSWVAGWRRWWRTDACGREKRGCGVSNTSVRAQGWHVQCGADTFGVEQL
jgi:hypothetical protein